MPRRSASLRIERPPTPSSSTRSSAAATISLARGVSSLGALEAIARPQAVADRAVEGDVEAPRERADEEGGRDEPRRRQRSQHERPQRAVQEVVQADGARVQLPLREPTADSEEESDVGAEAEGAELPVALALLAGDEDGGGQEQRGSECVDGLAGFGDRHLVPPWLTV